MDKEAADGFKEALRGQLSALEQALLRYHHQEIQTLAKQSVAKADSEADGGKELVSVDVDAEEGCLMRVYDTNSSSAGRWAMMALRLLGSDPRELPKLVVPGQAVELHMRPVWSHSFTETVWLHSSETGLPAANTTRQTRLTLSLSESISTQRINDALAPSTWFQRFVAGPQSNIQLAWSLLACTLILWDLITLPLEMFDVGNFTHVLDVMGVVGFFFWLIDMPLHLCFGVQVGGSLELRPWVLGLLYLRSWLAVDLVIVSLDATVMVLHAVSAADPSALRSARLVRSLRLLRLLRLVRVAKMQREMSLLATRFLSTYVFMLLKLVSAIVMMLVINHLIACGWYGVGSFLSTDDRNWLQRSGLEQAGFAEAYVASLHWSLTQFTPATNSIAPDNALERFFAICVILLAMCVFSSFIGTISATVNSLRNAQGQKLKQEENLLRFFIERNLSLDLYSKVQEVVRRERLTEARLSEEEVELLQRLPQRFKMQMHEEMYLFALLHLGIWPPWSSPDTDPVFNTLCHHAMKDHLAKPGEDVFMPGTACHHVCIIESGHMSYSLAGAPPEEATPGSVVALPCLWAEWSHCGRLMARTGSCYYVTLNGDDFCEVVMRFGGPLLRFLQIMGVLLIGELESAQDQSQLSDLTSLSNIREVSERAQRFTKLIGTTPDKSVHATFSILANKAQGGLFGRLQTRNLSPFG